MNNTQFAIPSPPSIKPPKVPFNQLTPVQRNDFYRTFSEAFNAKLQREVVEDLNVRMNAVIEAANQTFQSSSMLNAKLHECFSTWRRELAEKIPGQRFVAEQRLVLEDISLAFFGTEIKPIFNEEMNKLIRAESELIMRAPTQQEFMQWYMES